MLLLSQACTGDIQMPGISAALFANPKKREKTHIITCCTHERVMKSYVVAQHLPGCGSLLKN